MEQIGRWLSVNGEGIWNTTGYPFGIARGCTEPPQGVAGATRQCYTKHNGGSSGGGGGDGPNEGGRALARMAPIYITTTAWPSQLIFAADMALPPSPTVTLVGAVSSGSSIKPFPVKVDNRTRTVVVNVPPLSPAEIPAEDLESSCYLFKLV